jgi:hypothetical protein
MMFFEVGGVAFCSPLCVQFICGKVTTIVFLYNLNPLWWWFRLTSTERQGSLWYMPRLQCPVVLDDFAEEVWDKEYHYDVNNGSSHTNN